MSIIERCPACPRVHTPKDSQNGLWWGISMFLEMGILNAIDEC